MSLRIDEGASLARARSAISLGAAFALFGFVLLGYDTPASEAAGGLIEAVFGAPRVPTEIYYGSYAPADRASYAPLHRLRHAKRQRPHDLQARRRVVERRKIALHLPVAQLEQRRPAAIEIIAPRRNADLKILASTTRMAGAQNWRAACAHGCDDNPQNTRPNCERPCPGASSTRADHAPITNKIEEASAVGTATAFYADPTLRPGDTVVTPQGVRILRHGSHYPYRESDFLSLAEAGDGPLSNRGALNEIDRALKTPLGRNPGSL